MHYYGKNISSALPLFWFKYGNNNSNNNSTKYPTSKQFLLDENIYTIYKNTNLLKTQFSDSTQIWRHVQYNSSLIVFSLHICLEFSVCENTSKWLLSIHFRVWFLVLDSSDDTPISGFCYWILDFAWMTRCM